MQAVHAFVTAFAKAVRGVLFKLAALCAFNPWNAIGETILTDITRFAQPSGAGQFQLPATGTDYFFKFASGPVSFLITFLAQASRIERFDFTASDTFGRILHFIVFSDHGSQNHFTKTDLLCQ